MADRACVDFLAEHLGDRLSLLKLQGNPLVSEVPSYRKTVVCGFTRLNYLDDMPVFPKDRRLAEAWQRGGVEEEKAERARCFADEVRSLWGERGEVGQMTRVDPSRVKALNSMGVAWSSGALWSSGVHLQLFKTRTYKA